MDLITAFGYVAGVICIVLVFQVMSMPFRVAIRLLMNSIVGGVALYIVNVAGSFLNFHMALNPFSAMVTGMLGVPGVVSLVIIRIMIRHV